MFAYNINWDFDIDNHGSLPKEIEIPKGMTDPEEIGDWLTDTYGYCHHGFAIGMTDEERKEYCKDCLRSIYSEDAIGHSCDTNIADKGYYNHANYPCYCKVTKKEA